ncbi:Ribosomal protein L9/RNase H1, N-terminal [Sesbania bispinosa]|nr:Ribosomal protein L9/RNase H1, N-terminal [Sesbania bispinosa]
MSSFDLGKSYVVYSGRRIGIYSSWIDCFVQVDRFKGSVCDVFNSHGEALSAWESFCSASINCKRSIIRSAIVKEEASVRLLNMVGSKKYSSDYVMWVAADRCVAQWNMQICLRQACHILRMGDAGFTRQDVKEINGKNVLQIYGFITNTSYRDSSCFFR